MKKNKLLKYLSERNWDYTIMNQEKDIEFSFYTPAGEDYRFQIETKNIKKNLVEYLKSFEWDEHVEFWIIANSEGATGVPTLKTLIKDAQWIENEFEEIMEWLEDV